MASSRSKSISLLLVGRTGNGKSSVGNSILGAKVFTPRGSSAPVQVDIQRGEAFINSQAITVVDGPGIGDASFDNPEEIQATLNQVNEALSLCPNGFSAFLIVLKYGIRFTNQERDAIAMIKSIFGPDVVRKYGIIVMSYGDSFELDMEDEGMNFEDWCKEQTGDVKALFTECDNRCVLFNNRTKEPEKLNVQMDSLMSKVERIRGQITNYTTQQYDSAAKERRKLIVRSKLPEMEKKTEKFLDEISDQLNQLGSYNRDDAVKKLNTCSDKINDLKMYLQQEDQGTGCTEVLQTQVKVTEMTIQSKLRMLQNAADDPMSDRGDIPETGNSSTIYDCLSRLIRRFTV